MTQEVGIWTPEVTTMRAAHWPANGIRERHERQPWIPYVIDGDTMASIRAAEAIMERQRRDDMLMEYLDDYGDQWDDDDYS